MLLYVNLVCGISYCNPSSHFFFLLLQSNTPQISHVAQISANCRAPRLNHRRRSELSFHPSHLQTSKSSYSKPGSSMVSSWAAPVGRFLTKRSVRLSIDCGGLGTNIPWRWNSKLVLCTRTRLLSARNFCQSSRRKDGLVSWKLGLGNAGSGHEYE